MTNRVLFTYSTLALLFVSTFLFARCVDEHIITGDQIANFVTNRDGSFYVQMDGKFIPYSKHLRFQKNSSYVVHRFPKTQKLDAPIEYFGYDQLIEFIDKHSGSLLENQYQLENIGTSVEGRSLHAIYPAQFSVDKKTIIMLGRQHGDEGTQNWIIDGFINHILTKEIDFLSHFQLILYPMINPDGTEKKIRYNSNSYDLNRVWNNPKDEIATVKAHLDDLMKKNNLTGLLLLDMHGSFTDDFIFRVTETYAGKPFFDLQSLFINRLGMHDPWQGGNFRLSNGAPGMARIVYVNQNRMNALTHETPREIEDTPSRNKDTLRSQGEALVKTIRELYQ